MFFYSSLDNAKKVSLFILLLSQSMVIQAESPVTTSVEPEVAAGVNNEDKQWGQQIPRWPERQQVNKEIIPPPPPGPYMSLALNDFSVNRTSFDDTRHEAVTEFDSANLPMETFSPDIPWPENLRPSKRWMPENGYSYVKKSYPVTVQNSPSTYNYGYRPSPKPNMNSSASRWMPSMATAPGETGPYLYNNDSGYSYPLYNYRAPSVNPAYRVPYPFPGKP